ncbi:MAG: hypothetical protein C6I01_04060 [Epsilonproteobacteria bacterium]|jgi:outer membrane murein-binding lipoprotein Lpp|nr:hypothetical protein [Campylobacterota bacterium]NPA89417.1 hypothetical protein [Campylobacterota bacterium]
MKRWVIGVILGVTLGFGSGGVEVQKVDTTKLIGRVNQLASQVDTICKKHNLTADKCKEIKREVTQVKEMLTRKDFGEIIRRRQSNKPWWCKIWPAWCELVYNLGNIGNK